MSPSIRLRHLAETDSLDAITRLLHRAYARLGAMGLNYTAVDQAVAVTRQRIERGQCFVLDDGAVVVGTVVVNGGYDSNLDPWARASPWYYRGDVAHFHQLAVEASLRGEGWGDRLVAACESWAAQRGFRGIALDTAVPAAHLRSRYARLGYRDVDEVQWPGKRYRSVVMLKPLQAPAPAAIDAEHRCAIVRTLWAHVQARDWPAMRALLADACTTYWPASRERFLNADAIVRTQELYPEGWSIAIGEVFATSDGRVVSTVTVKHEAQTFFARSIFGFGAESRVETIDEIWATYESPPAWRTAGAIGADQQS